jgi:hypothetical protein
MDEGYGEPLERCHETAAVALDAKVILVPSCVLHPSFWCHPVYFIRDPLYRTYRLASE